MIVGHDALKKWFVNTFVEIISIKKYRTRF